MRQLIALLVLLVATGAAAQTETPTTTPTRTPTSTPTHTPTNTAAPTAVCSYRTDQARGPMYTAIQSLTGTDAVTMLDAPTSPTGFVLSRLFISTSAATVVTIASGGVSFRVDFAAAGSQNVDVSQWCLPAGASVTLDQTGAGTIQVVLGYWVN